MAVIDVKTALLDPALDAYERCADYYDVLTDGYDHEAWVGRIETLARAHGLGGRRALDAACGTGKSTVPLVRRGYDVCACDLSPAMVRRARIRLGPSVRVFVADVRALSLPPRFDLITCLDDALNYLLSEDELCAALSSFAAALAPGGVAAFDLNTVATYRDAFCPGSAFEAGGGALRWRGVRTGRPGVYAASIDASRPGWNSSTHLQRHHSPAEVAAAAHAAGLEVLAAYGQSPGGVLDEGAREDVHTKVLYLLARGQRMIEPNQADLVGGRGGAR
jgi:SAM-dependent methyltransferase